MALVAHATITALLEHLHTVAVAAGMMELPEAICISGQATVSIGEKVSVFGTLTFCQHVLTTMALQSLCFVQQAIEHVFQLPLVITDGKQAQGSAMGACRAAQHLAQVV
jgi:hypothetical protein